MEMDIRKRLGKNIRGLRVAYGETQEKLSEAIGYSKNAVSNYENGIREPEQDTLATIAKHYSISVEELLTSDFSNIDNITINQDSFWNNIDVLLPVTCTDTALQNKNFKKAYDIHRKFFNQLRKSNMDKIDDITVCFNEYCEAYEDSNSKVESAANFIGLWFLFMLMLNTPNVIKERPAALMQVVSRDVKAKRILENTDPRFEKEAKEIMDSINDSGIDEILNDFIIAVKKSKEWYELADYYIALQFVWNLADNELGLGINRRIGIEMMYAFAKVGNPYASQFIFSNAIIK